MINIKLSESDFGYLLIATFCACVGAGILGAAIAYFVISDLDEIPEGEEPYFTFTNKTKEE